VSVSPIIHLKERSSLCGLARKKDVAKYKKKRARELQHDKFRDTANTIFERLGERLEGKGKAILYGLVGLLLLAVIVGVWLRWSNRKADEARRALGRAIAIATTPVSTTTPAVEPTSPVFGSEQEKAQRAIDEFQKVAAKYGEPYRTEARYFIATNLLYIDRDKAINELTELTKSNLPEVATLSKFSLAQAREAEGKLDDAGRLYSELASQNNTVVTPDTANLRLAEVYEKQGKKKEAADLLFNIVDAARNAKDKDGTPLPQSAAAAAAAEKLQKLDPDRYAKVAPPSPVGNSPF
jgi:tetrahydromethanopterin S-methyltransferase subunit G